MRGFPAACRGLALNSVTYTVARAGLTPGLHQSLLTPYPFLQSFPTQHKKQPYFNNCESQSANNSRYSNSVRYFLLSFKCWNVCPRVYHQFYFILCISLVGTPHLCQCTEQGSNPQLRKQVTKLFRLMLTKV